MDEQLKLAIEAIDKKYGPGSVVNLMDKGINVETVSSGSIKLDEILGVYGYPKGRIIEIYGPESSGKTTLTLHAIAEHQAAGGLAAFIDAEHALDPEYAAKLGVDVEKLLISQPNSGEEALDIAETLIRSGSLSVVVIDSVSALVPQKELDGDMGDSHMGLQARLMSQAMRKLTGLVAKSNATLFFINQIRSKIGVMFGSPETTSGGRALKFAASMRLDIRRVSSIKEDNELIGNLTRIKVVKNKVAPPFKECEVELIHGEGISKLGDMIDVALDIGILEKSGAWYKLDDRPIAQGRKQMRELLRNDHELADRLLELISLDRAVI
jgi:recombination protein RecA